jgi:hypothetical protein
MHGLPPITSGSSVILVNGVIAVLPWLPCCHEPDEHSNLTATARPSAPNLEHPIHHPGRAIAPGLDDMRVGGQRAQNLRDVAHRYPFGARYDAQTYTNDTARLVAALQRDLSHASAIEVHQAPAHTITPEPAARQKIHRSIGLGL